jgi:hypothetical protein
MNGIARWLGATAVVVLGASGCTEYAPLVERPPPDCGQPAPVPGGFEYTIAGHVPDRVNWTGCDMAGRNLAGTSLGAAILVGTNLSNASLDGADLGAANLSGANLSGASLRGTDLTGVGARNASFANADLTGATMQAGTYYRADFSGATWTDGATVCPPGAVGQCRVPEPVPSAPPMTAD